MPTKTSFSKIECAYFIQSGYGVGKSFQRKSIQVYCTIVGKIMKTQSNPTLGNHQSVEDVSFICYAKEMTSNHENVLSRRGGLSQSREEALFSFSHLRGWQTFAQSLSHSAPLFMTEIFLIHPAVISVLDSQKSVNKALTQEHAHFAACYNLAQQYYFF